MQIYLRLLSQRNSTTKRDAAEQTGKQLSQEGLQTL
jgi:hypothetical protein